MKYSDILYLKQRKLQMNIQKFTEGTVSIYDMVQAPEIAAYWVERNQEQPPYLGEILFPNDKQEGLEISWFLGETGAPIALRPSGWDTQAIPRDRKGFDDLMVDMIFFKESYRMSEKERQKLIMVLQTGNQRYIDIMLNKIFDDVTRLINGASVRREVMRMEMLTTGTITVTGNGQDHNVDYEFKEEHRGNAEISWSDLENANPIEDIRKGIETIETNQGVTPTRALCNRSAWNKIRTNKIINRSIAVFGDGRTQLTDNQIKSFLMEHLNLEVVVYDKMYKGDDGVMRKFVRDDIFVLFPEGELGRTCFGTTPEEADLVSSDVANVSIVDTGVAITSTQETDPVNSNVKVSMVSLPTFERMNEVFILETVAAI